MCKGRGTRDERRGTRDARTPHRRCARSARHGCNASRAASSPHSPAREAWLRTIPSPRRGDAQISPKKCGETQGAGSARTRCAHGTEQKLSGSRPCAGRVREPSAGRGACKPVVDRARAVVASSCRRRAGRARVPRAAVVAAVRAALEAAGRPAGRSGNRASDPSGGAPRSALRRRPRRGGCGALSQGDRTPRARPQLAEPPRPARRGRSDRRDARPLDRGARRGEARGGRLGSARARRRPEARRALAAARRPRAARRRLGRSRRARSCGRSGLARTISRTLSRAALLARPTTSAVAAVRPPPPLRPDRSPRKRLDRDGHASPDEPAGTAAPLGSRRLAPSPAGAPRVVLARPALSRIPASGASAASSMRQVRGVA